MTAAQPADEEHPGGCGLQGCLTAAMILFAVLLIGMLVMVLTRIGPGL